MAPAENACVFGAMKTTHAINFFLVGLTMCFSPAYWPDYFLDDTGGGTSELWLLVMGSAQMAMGAWALALNAVPRTIQYLAEWEPFRWDFYLPDVSWALPESFYAGLQDDDDLSAAMSLQQQLRMKAA